MQVDGLQRDSAQQWVRPFIPEHHGREFLLAVRNRSKLKSDGCRARIDMAELVERENADHEIVLSRSDGNMRSPDSDDRPTPNCYCVKPWRFAAGAYPGPVADSEARERLQALLEAGINHCIDLTEPREVAGLHFGLSMELKTRMSVSQRDGNKGRCPVGLFR